MRLRYWLVLAAILAIAAFGTWWDHGGQHWLAIHTGTDYCVNLPAQYQDVCKSYGYWSGFGSVFPWVLIGAGGVLGVLWAHLRQINCHEEGCPWIGRYPVAGGAFKYCGKHHPDWAGKHPPRHHILERHELHKQAVAAQADCAPAAPEQV